MTIQTKPPFLKGQWEGQWVRARADIKKDAASFTHRPNDRTMMLWSDRGKKLYVMKEQWGVEGTGWALLKDPADPARGHFYAAVQDLARWEAGGDIEKLEDAEEALLDILTAPNKEDDDV